MLHTHLQLAQLDLMSAFNEAREFVIGCEIVSNRSVRWFA
jgi:hypothetical protein